MTGFPPSRPSFRAIAPGAQTTSWSRSEPSLQFFVSHSSTDGAAAEALSRQIEAVGVKAWLYEYDRRPGEYLPAKIINEIQNSAAMVVLLTTDGTESYAVHQEIGVAVGKNKLVIPLVETGVSPSALVLLQGLEYIEFDPANPAQALNTLTTHIAFMAAHAERTRRSSPPAPPLPLQAAASAPASPTVGLVVSVQIDREVALALALLAGILIVAVVVSAQ